MQEILVQLWKFSDAPDEVRCLVPLAYAGGWLAIIYPGSGEAIVQNLIDRWNSSGFSLTRCEMEDGAVILAGQHVGDPTAKGPLS